MNQNNENSKKPNNNDRKYVYYENYNKYYNRLYSQGRCPALCPIDHTQCTLTEGHWGKHKCSQGHEWF